MRARGRAASGFAHPVLALQAWCAWGLHIDLIYQSTDTHLVLVWCSYFLWIQPFQSGGGAPETPRSAISTAEGAQEVTRFTGLLWGWKSSEHLLVEGPRVGLEATCARSRRDAELSLVWGGLFYETAAREALMFLLKAVYKSNGSLS